VGVEDGTHQLRVEGFVVFRCGQGVAADLIDERWGSLGALE
jgi:hypothetical protein